MTHWQSFFKFIHYNDFVYVIRWLGINRNPWTISRQNFRPVQQEDFFRSAGLFNRLCFYGFYFDDRTWSISSQIISDIGYMIYIAYIIWPISYESLLLNCQFYVECDLFWPSFRHVFKSISLVLSQYCWDDPKTKQNDSTHFKSSSWTFAKWLMLHDSRSMTTEGL